MAGEGALSTDRGEAAASGRDPWHALHSSKATLGRALADRLDDVVERVRVRALPPLPSGKKPLAEVTRLRDLAVTQGTELVVSWLTTGVVGPLEELESLSRLGGRAAAASDISLSEAIRSSLCWRDVVIEVLQEQARRLSVPPSALEEAVDGVRTGFDSNLLRTARHFDVLNRELETDLEESRARLVHQALHDHLTGLHNRASFFDCLGDAMARSAGARSELGVLVLDLDRFKVVNDTYGHTFGDRVLVAVAERLKTLVRPGDTVARIGGDEFVILCEGLPADRPAATAAAERIGLALTQPFRIEETGEVWVSASIGIALASQTDDPELLVAHADAAMYRAKENGRARYEVFVSD